jgi:hypothetical protein
MTSPSLADDGFGRVFVDLSIPWDNKFAFTPCPYVVLSPMAGKLPTERAEHLLKITTFH